MKKYNFAKNIVLFMLCAVFMFCSGCGISENDEQAEIYEKLSTIFVGTEYELPDDWRMNSGFLPEYNSDTESFLVYAEKSEEEEDENGSVFRRYSGVFFSVNSDGSVTENLTFVMPKHSEYVLAGRLSENALYMITFEHDDSTDDIYTLHRIDINSGEVSSAEINAYFGSVGTPEKILLDADENIYLYGYGKAVSLTSDFVYRFSVSPQKQIKSIAEGADGSIWICAYDMGVLCAEKVDTENGNITASYELNDMESRTFLSAPRECEYDFYFVDNSNLYGAKIDEDGKFVKTPIIGLINSGILNDTVAAGGRREFTASPIAAFGNGTFLFIQLNSEQKKMNPALYRAQDKVDDINDIRTINIAYARQPLIEYTETILRFKREHPDILINILDYTVYEGEGAWDSAADKLAFDIANGFAKPDIVIGKISGADIDLLYRNSMYTDLTPYLQTDETVNFDTLFGCIPRVFDDGNGGTWGICTQFMAETLLSTREMLGEYGQIGLVQYSIWGKGGFAKYKVQFGRDDVVPIGRATVTNSGIRVLPDITCVITSFSENPDLCWELISDLCEIREIENYAMVPSLKTVMEEYVEKLKEYNLIYEIDNNTVGKRKRDPENPLTEEDFSRPVVIFSVDEDDMTELFELLDNAGYPIADELPDGVGSIVSEEVSAFLAGMGTAEECGKKIQSRVNILLAEKGD